MITFIENYGPIKKDTPYRVIKRKNDWVLVSFHGNPIYVPAYLIGDQMNLVSKVDEQLIRTVANAIFDAAGLETVASINRDDFIELTSNFIFDVDVLPKWKRIIGPSSHVVVCL